MKLLDRKIVTEKLSQRIGSKRTGWMTNEFKESWEEEHISKEENNGNILLDYVKSFLKEIDMGGIVFLPDSYGWQTYSDNKKEEKLAPVAFDSVDEAIEFLDGEIFWGVDNYYIADTNFDWIITICHELDLHVNGTKKFVGNFIKNYLSKNESP